ncbi:hypothetical protein B0J11DRAFT_501207 [Dendryphion nanum]|uniref:Uncharacterized protein n=1 Tax=Dendryphion nanum TaxID=256645 RepID=A0A9P9J2J6_9PLEO|nr:hypothetical protein B0J11DRAFT_501207 [Dendryphion nanum]
MDASIWQLFCISSITGGVLTVAVDRRRTGRDGNGTGMEWKRRGGEGRARQDREWEWEGGEGAVDVVGKVVNGHDRPMVQMENGSERQTRKRWAGKAGAGKAGEAGKEGIGGQAGRRAGRHGQAARQGKGRGPKEGKGVGGACRTAATAATAAAAATAARAQKAGLQGRARPTHPIPPCLSQRPSPRLVSHSKREVGRLLLPRSSPPFSHLPLFALDSHRESLALPAAHTIPHPTSSRPHQTRPLC